MLVTIPFLGYLIDFAKQPMGFALLVIIPVAIVIIDELRKILAEIKKIRVHRREQTEKKKAAKGEKSQDPFTVGKDDGEKPASTQNLPAGRQGFGVAKPSSAKDFGEVKKDPFLTGKSDREGS